MSAALNEICHYLPICDRIATSGQPQREQFAAIQAAGYEVIVNLAMPNSSNWLADERDVVAALGLEYVPIPVVWEYPTLDDLEQVFEVLGRHRKTWVHCALNMRVSAMLYLYNRIQLGMADAEATAYLIKIWTPNDVWQTFMDAAIELYAP
jgi:protein tyrosine phosphatase (PTP) superfamily phosphohydrolase (DUF442 family)